MESSLSDLQFSVSEFEQAGLLPDLDNEVFSPPETLSARQKARTNVVENQLASTLTELQELRIQKQQLEQELQQAQGSGAVPTNQSVAYSATEDFEDADSDPDVAPSVTISIQGRRQQVTAEEILTMPAEQYAMLWKAYTTELKSCLQLCANANSPAEKSRLNQLTFETIMLRDTRLKTDVNSARFMSSEPASFFSW
ncbi:hypothetical protein WJX82_003479 [Trebouxia sp. C0006]